MKNFAVIHILIFLICMLIYQCATAQTDYLITTKADSIPGEIKILSMGPEKKVQIKNGKKKEIYSILHTKKLVYNGDTFHPIKGPSGYVFMKLQKPGYLSIYAYQTDNRSLYDGTFLVKADGTSLDLPNLGFKKQMTNFLEDCPKVSGKIENGELNRKDIDVIVEEYNSCITAKSRRAERIIVENRERVEKTSSWDELKDAIQTHEDFQGKSTALEMVNDIKTRISKGEQVPNFVIEGLKSTLAPQAGLKEKMDKALSELN